MTSWILWVFVAVVVAAGIILALRIITQHGTATVFMTTYLRAHRATGDHRESLAEALTLFRYRRPFNELTDDDIDFLVGLFATVPNAMALGSLIQHADKTRSVRQLTDRDHMKAYAEYAIRKIEPPA